MPKRAAEIFINYTIEQLPDLLTNDVPSFLIKNSFDKDEIQEVVAELSKIRDGSEREKQILLDTDFFKAFDVTKDASISYFTHDSMAVYRVKLSTDLTSEYCVIPYFEKWQFFTESFSIFFNNLGGVVSLPKIKENDNAEINNLPMFYDVSGDITGTPWEQVYDSEAEVELVADIFSDNNV